MKWFFSIFVFRVIDFIGCLKIKNKTSKNSTGPLSISLYLALLNEHSWWILPSINSPHSRFHDNRHFLYITNAQRQWDVQIAQKTILEWNQRQSGPKALVLANDMATILHGGEIRAVESLYIIFTLDKCERCIFSMQGKNIILITIIQARREK